jgi:hypothetical protein
VRVYNVELEIASIEDLPVMPTMYTSLEHMASHPLPAHMGNCKYPFMALGFPRSPPSLPSRTPRQMPSLI